MSFMKLGMGVMAAAAIATAAHGASAEPAGKMSIKRLTLAHGVDAREPQEPTTSFKTSDDRVYAFVELDNPTKTEGHVHVVFQSPSAALPEIVLDVGALPHFRTWAFTRRAREAGAWSVTVRDDSGRLLGTQSFTVS